MQYTHKLSPSLKVELERLKNGDSIERQRYNKALSAINKAAKHPLNDEFKKTLPSNYKAADVLQQYRVFFRIVPAAESGEPCDVVYFVWINDENSIHRSGEANDSYAVFRKLLAEGKIDPYVPTAPPPAKGQFFQDNWGNECVYARFERKPDHASTHLILNRITQSSYRIDYITVSKEDVGLASALLDELCQSAQKYNIELTYELAINAENFGKTRHLLEKFKFEFTEQIDGVEIWERSN